MPQIYDDEQLISKIKEIIKIEPHISQDVIGLKLSISRRIVQKYINVLKNTNKLFVWEVNETDIGKLLISFIFQITY